MQHYEVPWEEPRSVSCVASNHCPLCAPRAGSSNPPACCKADISTGLSTPLPKSAVGVSSTPVTVVERPHKREMPKLTLQELQVRRRLAFARSHLVWTTCLMCLSKGTSLSRDTRFLKQVCALLFYDRDFEAQSVMHRLRATTDGLHRE